MTCDEIDPDLRQIIEGVIDVKCILDSTNDIQVMMQILASATAHILCSKIGTEEEARGAYEVFHSAVGCAIERAKAANLTMWVEGTPH